MNDDLLIGLGISKGMRRDKLGGVLLIGLLLQSFAYAQNWILNNPYPSKQSTQKIYYSSFTEQPKTLDPAKSYSSNEYLFITQIYEPVVQYDYFERPYKLIPLTAAEMPQVYYYDTNGDVLQNPIGQDVAKSVYTIRIKPGILYQPHPAFDLNQYPLPKNYLKNYSINALKDFAFNATRELVADDYIYEIKRLANPRLSSSIYGLMSQYILGFREFGQKLPQKGDAQGFIDLRQYPLEGLKKIDDYTFEITIIGHYPQFMFWLSMPFFSPIPWEVDRFYAQPGMREKNINFGWYPVGTGPFMLSENNPNSKMILDKNPNYRMEYFPTNGKPYDVEKGYTRHTGQRIPMIDKAIYTLEKESIPRWSKFLQGYYDLSGISADSFDQAIQIDTKGTATLSKKLKLKGMRLDKTPELSVYYWGFNMLDPIVGGQSNRARKLRRAISIAVNFEEYIAIFLNERGYPAQSPLPHGIFGHRLGREGFNPYVYSWEGHSKRRSIAEAKALMKAAGYPNGRDIKTGRTLILHYDTTATGGPDDKAEMDWMRKQFAKIGIDLDVRATQYNRFQEKMRTGNAQIYKWGWNADYPDPENFLFLLYGANGKVKHGGENASNYNNPKYDRLFDAMKNRENDATRQNLIDQMLTIIRSDAPWMWGINSELFTVSQQWVSPIKASPISIGNLKYVNIDVELREKLREKWNKPIFWPIAVLLGLILIFLLPLVFAYRRKQGNKAPRVIK